MVKNIGKEMKSFIRDLKENIKDPEELKYLLNRTESMFDSIFEEIEKYIGLMLLVLMILNLMIGLRNSLKIIQISILLNGISFQKGILNIFMQMEFI